MAAQYSNAPEVAQVAKDLISQHHPHLSLVGADGKGVRIEYYFTDTAPKSGGKEVIGKARKITSLAAFMAGGDDEASLDAGDPFFAIVIHRPSWLVMDADRRRALVDHELCHLGVTVDDEDLLKLSIIAHDVEEFRAVIERHGLWSYDVRQFSEAVAAQLPLRFDLDGGEASREVSEVAA